MTYLERRICERHWEEHCQNEDQAEAAAVESVARKDCHTADAAGSEEIQMSAKKSKSKQQRAVKEVTRKVAAPKSAKAEAHDKPKRLGALAAAAQVLSKARQPMRCPEMITAMTEQKLWTSPNGHTPEATLSAAILREIKVKGRESRFKKVDRGTFAFAR